MEKKYIVELPDENVKSADGYDWLQLLISVAYEPVMVETAIQLLPYTEPDMEKVRKESCDKCMNEAEDLAYQLYSSKVDEAYQRGLEDMREAARKICLNESDGGLSGITVHDIFNTEHYRDALRDYTSAKAIEKIRQYEQEKEEIKVWDEVRNIENGWIAVVCNIEGECMTLMDTNGALGDGYHVNRFTKTGRRFPEIAAVLAKMKEES